jgi:hypothetical protein
VTKPTSKSASETRKASSPSGTSGRTAATGSEQTPKKAAVEIKADSRGIFAEALTLAKKPKSKAEARRSLQEIGIITASGELADHYKAKAKVPKAVARKVVLAPSKRKATKGRGKVGA